MNQHMPKPLALLLAGAGSSSVTGNPDVTISSIAVDSRAAEPGALFVCLRGLHADGHRHAAAAVARGAVAVLAEHDVDDAGGATIVMAADTLAALSPIAAAFYDCPSEALTVVGVTGTNGKTTTTHFIEAIATAAKQRFGLIGTLGARLRGSFASPLEHTTPPAHELQRLLAAFRDGGASGAVIEVSSHALALHRVDDVSFSVATFTNLTQDHLDFHASLDHYRAAKRKLFELTARAGGVAVTNADDPAGAFMGGPVERKITYGINNDDAQLNAVDVEYSHTGSTFTVKSVRPVPFFIRLPGTFNVSNAMAALATAVALDFDVEAIAEGLGAVEAVPGRMTPVAAGDFGVYVDYAHTPDGLQQVLRSARALTKGRLICVFGCGGDRDRLKRPQMGRIARESSDVAIVTSDNPRFEDPNDIIEDVLGGVRAASGGSFEVIEDRAAAIERAINLARPGDVVIIAGKGHEAYQLIRDERRPFSDIEAARAAIDKVRA